jgi:protein-L-isoaspartate(D-aspartate) O-methyltransferase
MRRRLLLLVIPVAVIVAVFALQDQLDRGAAMDRPAPPADDQQYIRLREAMVREQIEARGVRSPSVLAAMRKVPRHRFVPPALVRQAYEDHPLPIGEGQTISQPYIVALMTELLRLEPTDRVLEVGTGSGYQAAVLAELCAEVYSIEIIPELTRHTRSLLAELGYANVHVKLGDGYRGWPGKTPFDGIIVTAAPDHVPQPLLDQLAPGGRLVIPVGGWSQSLEVYTRRLQDGPDGPVFDRENVLAVRFVPMTGEAEHR